VSRSSCLCVLMLICVSGLFAHPMGNFSVSHYAKLTVNARGIEIQYALDLAEIPTFELLRAWKMERSSPQSDLQRKATEQGSDWLKDLAITIDGKPAKIIPERTSVVIADGAGNLPIIRITTQARVNARGVKFEYEDHNYPERAGWKEIIIDANAGATLIKASHSNKDISKALTQYPPDPTLAPPQDLRAEGEWTVERPLLAANSNRTNVNTNRPPTKETVPPVVVAPIAQPRLAPRADAPALLTPQAAPQGAVTRGDFLSKLLHRRQLTPWMIFLALASAFALGAAHALTPGHGKTIVAAYLVGSRGTLKHAAFLGAMVTLTHTITVFALGLATLFLFRYIVPEKITQTLGVLSGLSIVAVGAWMLRKRLRRSHSHTHHHHPHTHDHGHAHSHHHHHGDGHAHSHMPDEISWGGLAALGASGGLVPCESALVLLLGAIALGRVGLGLVLLVSFSLGLALVLMIIGVLVLYAKRLIPERKRTGAHPFFQWLSVASPAIVIIVGLLMTGVSLGWIQPQWAIG